MLSTPAVATASYAGLCDFKEEKRKNTSSVVALSDNRLFIKLFLKIFNQS